MENLSLISQRNLKMNKKKFNSSKIEFEKSMICLTLQINRMIKYKPKSMTNTWMSINRK